MMEGGRLISTGGYGCIFTPPLLCLSGTKKNPNMVGKVTDWKQGKREIQQSAAIRKIPLHKNYFILPEPESCSLLPQDEQIDPGVEECLERSDEFQGILQNKKEMFPKGKVRQLFIPYGGDRNLFSLLFHQGKKDNAKMNFFHIMEHMLEAGSILLLAQTCHNDIHPGNVLIDKHNVLRLIDLGNSFRVQDINEDLVKNPPRALYYLFGANEEEYKQHMFMLNVEAPELNIMEATKKSQKPKYKLKLEDAIAITVRRKTIFAKMETFLGMSVYSSFEALLQFWKTSSSASKGDYVQVWKTYWPGFDAWSIGVLLFELYQIYHYDNAFVDGVYKKKKDFMLNALRGLLNPNPKLRLDCMEALAVLNPNNTWIERFGKKWLEARKKQRS